MGLLDALRGFQKGSEGAATNNSGGGMSPITMAILGYLAYKGVRQLGSSTPEGQSAPGGLGGVLGGGLAALLNGGLGSLVTNGKAGPALSTGLGALLQQFEQRGQGDKTGSWVSTGPNKDISEQDLAKSIGEDDIGSLSQQTGLSRDDLLSALRRELPGIVDQLTPQGRLPAPHELSQQI